MLYLRVVPGFGIAVEEARRPELCSSSVVMGGLPHQRGIVREANTMAQRCGVRPGMTLAQARQQCPDSIFLVPDLAHYALVWETMCDVLRTFTPLVEPLEWGEAVCDLQGCERLWTDNWSMARDMIQRVYGVTGVMPWIGIGSNRLMAQLASTIAGADGITIIETGQERAFLANLPLSFLPDLDARLALTFQVLGIRTIGELAALPAAAVRQRFGAIGENLHRYARGIDSRQVNPPQAKSVVSARQECEEGTFEEALAALYHLANQCVAELQARRLEGTLLRLTLHWNSAKWKTRTELPAVPPDSTEPVTLPSLTVSGKTNQQSTTSDVQVPLPTPRLSIGYRIHSMLPQPLEPTINTALPSAPPERYKHIPVALPSSPDPSTTVQMAVRTPISTVPPLFEHTQRLLLRCWPGDVPCQLQAIEVEISEFASPMQLSFDTCGRLDQTGGLAGMNVERRRALVRQDELLTARYGAATFQHVAQLDPGNVLTERRFRWETGLPWERSTHRSPKKAARRRA